MDPTRHETSNGSTAQAPGEDGLGELLRLAGPRPEIPDDRTARHHELAHACWQRKVRSRVRRRRWRLGLAAAAVVVLLLGIGWLRQHQARPTLGTEASNGPETLPMAGEAAGTPASARAGLPRAVTMPAVERGVLVQDQQWLETGGGQRVALRLASGHALRLDVATRLQLLGDSVLSLERGAVYVDSLTASPGSRVEVRTPLGVATDVGTRFEVRLTGSSLQVRVREGLVKVVRDDYTHTAGAGIELTLDAAGEVERRRTPVYGPAWQWSQEIAPDFDIEGRTLRELLDWVTRETGWRLRFDDPAMATGAATVILSGPVAGLTPAETLAAVLPTSGLSYRVVEGVLIIEPIATARAAEPDAVSPG